MKKNRRIAILLLVIFAFFTSMIVSYAQVPAPTLELKDAIDIAQQAVRNLKKVDIGDYYIYNVTYTNSQKGTFWYFLFKTIASTTGQEINVKVYMDKSTEFSGGYFTQR